MSFIGNKRISNKKCLVLKRQITSIKECFLALVKVVRWWSCLKIERDA